MVDKFALFGNGTKTVKQFDDHCLHDRKLDNSIFRLLPEMSQSF